MDAGHASETAFVGGINLNPHSVVSPGHRSAGHLGEHHNHDVYVEVIGPAATDVHHNFVQRWNEASERTAGDGVWTHDGDDDLCFPTRVSRQRGESLVQIQRTVHAARYGDSRPPEGSSFDIAGGERSIFEQYLLAIDAARRSIYIENQALAVPAIIAKLDDALKRGIELIVLVPGEPEEWFRTARRKPEHRGLFDQLAGLGSHERFGLVGIAGPDRNGGRSSIHVHAKIMLIDDAWATIGSCNLHDGSLFGHTEMNASFWEPRVVRALRCELLAEHLDAPPAIWTTAPGCVSTGKWRATIGASETPATTTGKASRSAWTRRLTAHNMTSPGLRPLAIGLLSGLGGDAQP